METKSNSFLMEEPVSRLMGKYAIPCIISLLVGALYNIVDQIFIANASYLGSYGNAANTVVFPLTVIALAIAVMVGDGCCAFVSLSLGKNRPQDAGRSMGNSILLTVLFSLVLCAVYLVFSTQIVAIFGGTVNEETYRHSKEYFFWISLGIPFYMFGQAMNPVIRADGSPKFAMASTLAGALVNVILDPVFIFVFRWGMMGAAVATVAGQIVTAVLAVWYLAHTKTVKLCREDFKMKWEVAGRTLALVIVEFFSVWLIGIFGAANESVYYTDFAVRAFRIYLCMIVLACINKAAFIFLQAMGKAAASTMLSMVREIVLGIGFALALPKLYGLDGVLYSMPVSDILTFIVSAIVIVLTYRQLNSMDEKRQSTAKKLRRKSA